MLHIITACSASVIIVPMLATQLCTHLSEGTKSGQLTESHSYCRWHPRAKSEAQIGVLVMILGFNMIQLY